MGTGSTTPGRTAQDGESRPHVWGQRSAAYAVWYLRVVAFLNFLGAVWVSFGADIRRHNIEDLFTPYLLTAGFTTGVFALFFAVTMRRRKRAAWVLNLVLSGLFLLVLALSMAAYGEFRGHVQNWITLALTGSFVAALLVGRHEFRAKGDRSNPLHAVLTAVGGLIVGSLISALLVLATNREHGSGFWDGFRYAIKRMIALDPNDDNFANISTPGWVDVVINVMSALLFLLVLYVAFRSPRGRALLGPEDETKLRGLLDRYGDRDSLGYFALRRDKSVIWSPSEKSAIAYRVVGEVSLASGDPIGDPEAWPGAIDAWLAEAREHAWVPAVMGASEEAGVIYARHGLDALEIGDEAIVETAEFTLDGRAMRSVRQAYNRVKRTGYTVTIRRHDDIPADGMDAVLEHADAWRDGETERGFSMALGRLGDPADGRCVMVECHDGEGVPRAVLSFVPWGPRGLSLDLMRRDRDSDNGLIEFMVIELIQRADEVGVRQISLNFAMFRSVFERGSKLGAGPVLRFWRSLLTFFSRWWQIESLYRANAKYRPIWEPRYLLFGKSSELPRIGIASARAEGFLEAPRLPSPLRRRDRERTAVR
ncbi:phosphatidylglycerol lysyltransferase domain-containing protein [Streptomyces sp. H39-S7]|uniref:phosphatidylglycerol lysyltransferase domain-containing protein n=1 Tax=Streptomyces sp. H39-S7 TaxID=3004357 RepID=UPI0022AF2B5E|nr:phosphatidylglycerol lysyltransferase domain-containing protein [Streptomyces sp. H39-S7]MCZ4121663.1 phosphatidylglycerol lysyltransferase domain-containing protein [Streptomyces sp. H39-S7]